MSQLSGNGVGSATVTITADTAPLKAGLAEARAETAAFAASVKGITENEMAEQMAMFRKQVAALRETSDGLTEAEKKVAALKEAQAELTRNVALFGPVVAAIAFQAGGAIEGIAEDLLGLKDSYSDVMAAIDDASKSPIERASARLRKLQEQAVDDSFGSQVKNAWAKIWGYTQGIDLETVIATGRAKGIENAEAALKNAQAAATKDRMDAALAQEESMALEGAERIERKREEAIRKIRTQFGGQDTSKLEEATNARYDAELRRLEELEARHKQAEDERAAREKAQSEERERREREALDRLARQQQEIADKTAAAISAAFSKARQDFASAISMKDLVVGVQALNANLENMRRNRQQIASGEVPSF